MSKKAKTPPIHPPRHGGIDEATEILPRGIPEGEILDFSISINPMGPPPGLREALVKALETIPRYPEITSETLTGRLAETHGLSPEHVIVGNGSSDLLFSLIPQIPTRKAVIPYPTFIEYERACALYGWEIRHVPPENTRDFSFDVPKIEEGLTGGSNLFLCQPNNPTGRCIAPSLLERLVKRADKTGGLVILDEAFLPFTETSSAIPWVTRFDNLIILRSMTKTYGIP
ncbi:MAG: hypothetical protein DSY91_05120, partial [Deltaproteobacteria bacterium]